MKRSLPLIFDVVHALALALWMSGAVSTLVMTGIGTMPSAFQLRMDSVVQFSAITCVGVQYLTRRKYINNRTLYIGDGIRHLLTFGALLLAFMGHGSHQNVGQAPTEAPLAALQLAITAAISGFTVWLGSPHALAFAATLNARKTATRG